MPPNGNTVFEDLYRYVKGSALSAWVTVLGIVLLGFGIVTFVEDSYSSYVGIQMFEKMLNLKPASWPITYLMLSVFFQVVTIIASLIFLSNPRKYWTFAIVALFAQAIDYTFDVWYRAKGDPFASKTVFLLSTAITLVFYTFGSEGAITFGFGLVKVMFVDGMTQLSLFARALMEGLVALIKTLFGQTYVQNQSKPQQVIPGYRGKMSPEQMGKLLDERNKSSNLPRSYQQRPGDVLKHNFQKDTESCDVGGDYRKLTESQKRGLLTMSLHDIQGKYHLKERTARNWIEFAKRDLLAIEEEEYYNN